ncbi:MAG: PAS domain-containing protein, partial [Coleofasciculaceae cyanobacterium SM2_3_26]|nr:PAS domain-containing protein [Coleofasciculaceae cyanobacterium SM2_3_26]
MLERLHAEEELTNFFNLSLDMLCVTVLAEQSDRSYFKRINPQFGAILGYDEATLLSLPILEFVHPGDRAVTRKEMQKLALGLPCLGFENRYRCADGTYRWLSWTAIPSIAEEGIVYAVARDVDGAQTNRKLALKSINQELEA